MLTKIIAAWVLFFIVVIQITHIFVSITQQIKSVSTKRTGERKMSLKYGEIIKQMSLEEKALMMSGKNTWETVDFEKYGIPSMAMSDGPHGLRRQAGNQRYS